MYLHPWELDPEQPRIGGPLKSRLRHYTNLHRMSAKVGAVLSQHDFQRFSDVLAAEAAENQSLPHVEAGSNHKDIPEHAQAASHPGGGAR